MNDMSEPEGNPRVLVAQANLFLFHTGEAGLQYENLSKGQFIKFMLAVIENFLSQNPEVQNGHKFYWWIWRRLTGRLRKC